MFELSVAWKYLLPRRRQLSVSIISLISIFVIALVVWLVVLFFSITNGMESHWIAKLIAITAPVRVTPTEAYYHSYYNQIDEISSASGYAHKSLEKKRLSPTTDPYDPSQDEEIPAEWTSPHLNTDGTLKDLVKETFAAIEGLGSQFPGLYANDYEAAFGNIRIRMLRQRPEGENQAFLSQAAVFGSLDPNQPEINRAILPLRNTDVVNSLRQLNSRAHPIQEDPMESGETASTDEFRKRLKEFLTYISITRLETPSMGWRIPRQLLPKEGHLKGLAVQRQGRVVQIFLPAQISDLPQLEQQLMGPEDRQIQPIELSADVSPPVPVLLAPKTTLSARLMPQSVATAKRVEDLVFTVAFDLQGVPIEGSVRYGNLEISEFQAAREGVSPNWVHKAGQTIHLPSHAQLGEGVLLPKAFSDAGVLVGDQGYLSYQAPTISTVQEQRVPIFVAGFYDPGVIPVGGKFVLVNRHVTSLIRSAYEHEDSPLTNGINVSFADYRKADQVKKQIDLALQERGLSRYWKVETFRHYEFTKELLQQLRSDKNLSMIIASVIILVACSNIVSMLVILVNDKKLEIGILRSMGASAGSIALIFGLCGVVMGLIGSFLGALAAIATLHHLDKLIRLIESVQGYDLFNPTFYGNTMPNELSYEGLAFVFATTVVISILAGIVPAIKASLMKPSAILRSE